MKARVKKDYRWETLIAFSGVEFVKYEYRDVPPANEKDVSSHPNLKIMVDLPVQTETKKKKGAK